MRYSFAKNFEEDSFILIYSLIFFSFVIFSKRANLGKHSHNVDCQFNFCETSTRLVSINPRYELIIFSVRRVYRSQKTILIDYLKYMKTEISQ